MLKSIILFSGGIDSTTLLASLLNDFDSNNILCLSFDYGQSHKREIQSAKQITSIYSIKNHQIITLSFTEFAYSSLIHNPANTEGKIHTNSLTETYVPFRNMVFLTYASALAEKLCIYDIYIGVNKTDSELFPDCSQSFIKSFEETANYGSSFIGRSKKLRIHAPYSSLEKHEIIKIGLNLGVDYSITHTCYFPDEKGFPCGKCDSCKKREEAFNFLNINNPLFKKE